jgi:hypothetical protein
MSGYNKKTGCFELTATKAAFWLRRPDIPAECAGLPVLDRACCVLQHCNIRVVANHGAWAEIEARPGQIWEALSGKPSDPERAAMHER